MRLLGDVGVQQGLERDEERLEVATTEAATSGDLITVADALDDLDEDRRAIEQRLGEDLQQAASIVNVDKDAEPLESDDLIVRETAALQALLNLGQLVVLVGCIQKVDAERILPECYQASSNHQ